jgi:hypothetical protein
MTLVAADSLMTANQWKARAVVIEPDGAAPTYLSMTLVAFASKAPFVYVVLGMTADARGRRLVLEEVSGMAPLAGNLRVRPLKHESCGSMIEQDLPPVRFVMATLAGRAIAAVVNILCLMTFIASKRQTDIARARVAPAALRLRVRTLEWEVCRSVIERNGVEPASAVVAIVTLGAEPALMDIGCLMTGIAINRNGSKLGSRDMASRTR